MSSDEDAAAIAAAAGGGNDDWCLIESDPGVFTELLEDLGVQGVELSELWSLDDESLLAELGTCQVYGLIFLFQWIGGKDNVNNNNNSQGSTTSTTRQPLPESDIPEDLFFAHQVTTNACATQAILSVLLNNVSSLKSDQLGSVLSEFHSFTKDFPPSLKGVAISSSEEIKKCHNSFSRQDAFLQEGKLHIPTGKEEAFHFVAYVPVNGMVYELDGLQKGPIVVGDVPLETTTEESKTDVVPLVDTPTTSTTTMVPAWLQVAREAIQERMALYQQAEGAGEGGGGGIKFNLMAVIQDKRLAAATDVTTAESEREMILQREEAKRRQWKLENERRRHNYVPLCVQLLKELAKLGQLKDLSQQATERIATKRQAAKKE